MCPLPQSSCCTSLTVMQWPLLTGTLVPHEGKIRQWLSLRLLSTLPIDWQQVTHPRLIVLRSQFKSELPPCPGGINNKELVSLVRRGLLPNVSVGVSVQLNCLSGGKWLLIYYGLVAMTFTVRQKELCF